MIGNMPSAPDVHRMTVRVPQTVLDSVDEAVEDGLFIDRSEAVRMALVLMFTGVGRNGQVHDQAFRLGSVEESEP